MSAVLRPRGRGSGSWGAAGGGCQRPREAAPGQRAQILLSPRRLLQQLEVAKCKKAAAGKSPAKAPAPAGDMLTFELFWRPEQDQFSQAAKVSVRNHGV